MLFSSSRRYLLASMHYDMPDLKGITDSSGVNLTMTAQLRENNLGMLSEDCAFVPVPTG